MILPLFILALHIASHATAPVDPARCQTCFAQQSAVQTAAADGTVTGVVHDSQGGVVAGAVVIARAASGGEMQTVTGAEGRFTIAGLSAGAFDLIVRAAGFAEKKLPIAADGGRQNLEVQLAPAGVQEAVTVTVTRSEQLQSDVPASVNVLTKDEIRRTPAAVADDVLRQIPTFSLFRRTSSVAAHPTTQGVSLRGVGPSGVSRTLVLLDGVPFNDPFGGWVFWSRVPIESAERIEVVDGASASLYGNYAMGGLINIVTGPPARRTFELRTQYGSLNSPKFDIRGSDVWGKLGVSVDASAFDTDGYATVRPEDRGAVDNKSSVTFKNVNVKADYAINDRARAFFRTGYFRENRDNGKITTVGPVNEERNDTTWKTASGGVRVRTRDLSEIQATVFYDNELFNSNNIAIPDAVTRATGRLSLEQQVPSRSVGGMVQWSRPIAGIHFLTAGIDTRWVDGDSNEKGFDAVTGSTVTVTRSSGGTQRSTGFYFQDLITPTSKLNITLSARLDRWRNYDGHNIELSQPSGAPTANNRDTLDAREDSVASPRVAALYHVNSRLTIWGDVGTAFRAPTLNELYRGFRVGTVQTVANSDLGPERLVGTEFGVTAGVLSNFVVRGTVFDNRVSNPVANVTTGQTGATVFVQRQNLGRTHIWGVQTDGEYRIGEAWKFNMAYLYGVSKVQENEKDPSLVGKFLAQVPKNRATLMASYANPRLIDVSLSVQSVGVQFDDDKNERGVPGQTIVGLPGYVVVGLNVSRQIDKSVEVFVGAQNLFNERYYVGTLPTLIGSPRQVNGGLRLTFRGR
jgi:outer membrane receptor protein involved in Fe transport